MADPVDTLLVDVRANTQGFAADVAAMRGTVDSGLLAGFERAGNVLEHGLVQALRKGSLGFEDLRRVALGALDQIARQATAVLFDAIGLGGKGSALAPLGSAVSALLGLPGRATGGPVAPGRGYVVGERGPELFVPTSAGRIEPRLASPAREVRVAITIAAPAGSDAPRALQRSTRQVASAVRRALTEL